ncbi:MAG TPA: nitrile hydratase subunit beta, partial [Porticoccaceae bacterium]|nr:nitrile hydratase subunit beta [Porticoccaceae bacterium]
MNGGHDLGGKQGLGPIDPEPETWEPVFHEEWERRVFALTLATGMLGHWNIDQSRHARERQHPADYLHHSYYENWLVGVEKLLT